MSDNLSLTTETETESQEHVVGVTKWAIIFVLMVTSLPAGFTPFIAAGAYRGIGHEEHVSTKWRIPQRIESGKHVLYMALLVLAATGIGHAALVSLSLRKWDDQFLGARGAVWFALAWSALVVGMTFGLWIYLVAPE